MLYYGSFEDDDLELSWAGASLKRSLQLAEQDYNSYRPRDFSGEEPEKPTYDPWTGGWF